VSWRHLACPRVAVLAIGLLGGLLMPQPAVRLKAILRGHGIPQNVENAI
jgi:hypothetical protein